VNFKRLACVFDPINLDPTDKCLGVVIDSYLKELGAAHGFSIDAIQGMHLQSIQSPRSGSPTLYSEELVPHQIRTQFNISLKKTGPIDVDNFNPKEIKTPYVIAYFFNDGKGHLLYCKNVADDEAVTVTSSYPEDLLQGKTFLEDRFKKLLRALPLAFSELNLREIALYLPN
jgi:hypothetical protein